jgi:hypothetical protein
MAYGTMTDRNDVPRVTRVAVIVHERLGRWSSQLRGRFPDRQIRWYETRSSGDLATVLSGLSAPVIVIDLGRNVAEALADLAEASRICPGAYVLAIDPDRNEGVAVLSRELGATEVISGFVPPPEVADLLDRWIGLATRNAERGEWSRALTGILPSGPEEWLEAVLSGQPDGGSSPSAGTMCLAVSRVDE